MKDGNWIPVSKALIKKLPKDRPFSEVEAAFSLQVAYDCNQDVSVAGLAARWMWSRRRTRGFIEEMGAAVSYQKNTSTLQNQRGQIAIQIPDRYRTDTGQIRLIDSKHLSVEADRKRTESGQKADRYRSTIKDPDPNPDPDKKDIGAKPSVFTPPTVQEVAAYCRERGNSVDPQRWHDSYTSKGWLIGKTKMKDWKAAVRTWESNEYGNGKPEKKDTHNGFDKRDYQAGATSPDALPPFLR